MHVQGFQSVNCDDAVVITKSINDSGDYILEIKLANEVIEVMKKSQADKEGCHISMDDSIFQTMLGNLIAYYLGSKTNFIKLGQTICVLHNIVGDVCHRKLEEAVDCLARQEDAKVTGEG